MDIERKLKELDAEIVKAKSDLAKAEGSIETHMARLKDEYNLDSVEDAEAMLEELEGVITNLEADIKSKLEKLEEIYGS